VNHPVCHRHPRKSLRELGAGPWGARTTRLRRPRIAPLVSQRIPVHRIPHHVRDDRDTPLIGAECEKQTSYSEKAKEKYFCAPNLNVTTALMRFTKFDFSRTRCPIAFAQGRDDAWRNRTDLPDVGCG